MIYAASHFSVFVLDQDEALAFYTQKLGFQVKTDTHRGDFRWLTICLPEQPELEIILIPAIAGVMFNEDAASEMRKLIRNGNLGVGVFQCKNIFLAYEELRQKGVNFLQEPKEIAWGIEALFEDNSGNWFSLTQRK